MLQVNKSKPVKNLAFNAKNEPPTEAEKDADKLLNTTEKTIKLNELPAKTRESVLKQLISPQKQIPKKPSEEDSVKLLNKTGKPINLTDISAKTKETVLGDLFAKE